MGFGRKVWGFLKGALLFPYREFFFGSLVFFPKGGFKGVYTDKEVLEKRIPH